MTKPDKSKRRGGKADAGLDGEASRRVRMLAAGAIPKHRKGKTRGVASTRWPIYEAQVGPIVCCLAMRNTCGLANLIWSHICVKCAKRLWRRP